MQNAPEAPMAAADIMSALREQLAEIQKSFTDALAQNQATLNQRQAEQEARHRQLIEDLQEEIRTLKMPTPGPQDRTPSPEMNTRSVSPEPAAAVHPEPTAALHPEPTTAPQRSERLPDPPIFTGKRRELRSFLSQLRNKLTGNADRYPTEANRLCYALSRLGGEVADLVEPLQPNSVQSLVRLLEATYGDPNRQATAQRKINHMAQEKKSFPVYFSEFNRYARETGWNDSALINSLVESLSPELKTSLIGVDLPEALDACANVINKRYNDILRLTPKPAPRYNTTTPRTTTKSSSQPKHPDAMDIDTGTLGYAPLGSSERERRIKLGLCFKCGSSSHLSNHCSVPMPKHDLRTADTNGRSPHRSSGYRPRSSPGSSPASSKHHSRGRSYNRRSTRTPPRSPPKGRSRS
jgi:hypothetical protein